MVGNLCGGSTGALRKTEEGFPEITFEYRIEDILAPLQEQQLADMIVSHFAGRGFVEILKVVDVADPNDSHMLIAALAARSGLRAVVTTNFDTLLERAGAAGSVSFPDHAAVALRQKLSTQLYDVLFYTPEK
jgi:NAD-dependent SIR2 family protein deacetylase